MRITKISVKGLFGMFDHEIPLNQESRITIVHGPNGVGKTVLMRMVHGLFSFDYAYLASVPFEELMIEIESGEIVTARKQLDKENLFVEYADSTGIRDGSPFEPIIDDWLIVSLFSAIQSALPDHKHFTVGGTTYWTNIAELWPDTDPDEVDSDYWSYFDSAIEILTQYDVLEKHPQIHEKALGKMPAWFARIRRGFRTSLFQTQRLQQVALDSKDLLSFTSSEFDAYLDPAVNPETGDLSSRARETLRRVLYSKFEELFGIDIESRADELLETMQSQEHAKSHSHSELRYEIRKRLIGAAKVDAGFIFDDGKELEQITAFESILNGRLLFKQLNVDEEKGFRITNEIGNEVQPSKLSSGEKQLLVLYYQLIFEIPPDTLVMIDEPELSMNVVWQRNFLKDLQRIIELRKFDVLIATHSPMIIHDKWDLVVHLGEKVDD